MTSRERVPVGDEDPVRVLLRGRVEELEDDTQLRQAETWQRAQAWTTWEKIKAGDLREVSKAELDADFDDALRQLAGPRSR